MLPWMWPFPTNSEPDPMNLSASSSPVAEPESYTLVIQNRLGDFSKLNKWLEELAQQLQLSERDSFRIDLALTEAVTNIVEHAYEDEADHYITITFRYLDQMASLELVDDGRPFNPLQQPEAGLPSSLEEAKEGGLGIHFIRSYTDELGYRRQSGQNILMMKFVIQ